MYQNQSSRSQQVTAPTSSIPSISQNNMHQHIYPMQQFNQQSNQTSDKANIGIKTQTLMESGSISNNLVDQQNNQNQKQTMINPKNVNLEELKNAFNDDDDDAYSQNRGMLGENDAESNARLMSYLPEQANQTSALKQGERIISDKQFQKEMQRLKERGANAVPPKKSASAYIIFGKEKRREILKRNPLAKVTEVVKEIAHAWGKMTKEDRQKYKDSAKLDKERYERELKSLEKFSESIKKPKKCLSAYMIFVKETRPKIVEANPDLGALRVMQEVGKIWQAMNQDQRAYFTRKADADKLRYLAEQRAFYDEVEKIGHKVGTVKALDGKVTVATNDLGGEAQVGKNQHVTIQNSNKNSAPIQIPVKIESRAMGDNKQHNHGASMAQHHQSSNGANRDQQNSLLVKRTHQQQQETNPSSKVLEYDRNKQAKLTQGGIQPSGSLNTASSVMMVADVAANSAQAKMHYQSNNNANFDSDKPKKPLSAYVYFCQELREVIRNKFPQLTINQIINFVSQRWQKLSKQLKAPFEDVANEDRKRYETEINEFKLGIYQGRNPFQTIRVQTSLPKVQEALKLTPEMCKELKDQAFSNEINGPVTTSLLNDASDLKKNSSQVIDGNLEKNEQQSSNKNASCLQQSEIENGANNSNLNKQQNLNNYDVKKAPTITSNNPSFQFPQNAQTINQDPQQQQFFEQFGGNGGSMIHESLPGNYNGLNQQMKDNIMNFSLQGLHQDDDNQNTDITSAQQQQQQQNAFQQAQFQGNQYHHGFFPHQQMSFGAPNPAVLSQQSAAQFFVHQQKAAQEQLMQGQSAAMAQAANFNPQNAQFPQQQQFGNFQFQNPFNPQQRIAPGQGAVQGSHPQIHQNPFVSNQAAFNPQIGVINPLVQMMPIGQNTYISQVFDEFGPVSFIQQPAATQQQAAASYMQAAANGGGFTLPSSMYATQQQAASKGPSIQNHQLTNQNNNAASQFSQPHVSQQLVTSLNSVSNQQSKGQPLQQQQVQSLTSPPNPPKISANVNFGGTTAADESIIQQQNDQNQAQSINNIVGQGGGGGATNSNNNEPSSSGGNNGGRMVSPLMKSVEPVSAVNQHQQVISANPQNMPHGIIQQPQIMLYDDNSGGPTATNGFMIPQASSVDVANKQPQIQQQQQQQQLFQQQFMPLTNNESELFQPQNTGLQPQAVTGQPMGQGHPALYNMQPNNVIKTTVNKNSIPRVITPGDQGFQMNNFFNPTGTSQTSGMGAKQQSNSSQGGLPVMQSDISANNENNNGTAHAHDNQTPSQQE